MSPISLTASDLSGTTHADVVVTYRGGLVENQHCIHAAVVNSKGELEYAVGNPDRITLARSAAKPIQTLAILETGAAEQFGFDDADIALMSASHSSEHRHISRAQKMLEKVGATEAVLACGGHAALSAAVNRAWIKQDYQPTGICNNCSGKHAGMVAGAVALDVPVQDYYQPYHPMQQRVRKAVEEVSGLKGEGVQWAVDGCNLPAPALPLRNLALIYAKLAEARGPYDEASDGDQTPMRTFLNKRERHLSRIHESMSTHADMIGGQGRFCTKLMETYKGLLVGKLGADGCYGVAVRASSPADDGKYGGVGIAVKVEDGNIDILYSAVIEILERLDVGTDDMRRQLDKFHHLSVKNTAGVITGAIRHAFEVRLVEQLS
ncbi:hypothetical protein N0V90_007047 [Kalmusia sp. IMI 367209]|nr:hypothetical protein N0V90_007047 [Kalmusia sp. IMI 367209]